MTSVERSACVLSALWIIGTATLFLWNIPPEGNGLLYGGMAVLCCVMPPAMAWTGLMALRAIRTTQERASSVKAAIDMLQDTGGYDTGGQTGGDTSLEETIALQLDEILATQRDILAALAELRTVRDRTEEQTRPSAPPTPVADAAPASEDAQVALPLGMPAEPRQGGLSRDDFITALNFPETPDDTAGFGALRRAMRDRAAAQVIRAAQDILTLMSQDGVYMDDLSPEIAQPDVWLRFAGGERGRGIAALGGVRDQEALDTTATRMKQDAIFRDVAHHFLRLFDRMFTEFAQDANDAEILDLAETRTARAFMLLGRVTGTFD